MGAMVDPSNPNICRTCAQPDDTLPLIRLSTAEGREMRVLGNRDILPDPDMPQVEVEFEIKT
jgi:hypothetical protein